MTRARVALTPLTLPTSEEYDKHPLTARLAAARAANALEDGARDPRNSARTRHALMTAARRARRYLPGNAS